MNLLALQKYCSIALVLLLSACWQPKEFTSQIFSGERIVSRAGEAPLTVGVSELIVLEDVKTLCLLGPYNETRYLDKDFHPGFVTQLGDFRVAEYQQFVAVYDQQNLLIVSEFQETWAGLVRFAPALGTTQRFCSDVRDVVAEISAKDGHTEVMLSIREK